MTAFDSFIFLISYPIRFTNRVSSDNCRLGNTAFLYLSVAFIQMLKALSKIIKPWFPNDKSPISIK